MERTIVVGLGRSGIGAAKLLASQGHHVSLIERGDSPEFAGIAAALQADGIDVQLGVPLELASFRPWTGSIRCVVISPGVPWDHSTLVALRGEGVPVIGEMAVAWYALRDIPWVGITGTNGKTTVTHLLNHVLQSAGLNAPMGGNMGVSAAEMALLISSAPSMSPDWLVMELSSYQIEAAAVISPRIGLWTTLTPDHLERHGSLEAYRAIKRGLLERSELAIFNADDPDLRQQRRSWKRGLGSVPKDLILMGTQQASGSMPMAWSRTLPGRCFPRRRCLCRGDHNRQPVDGHRCRSGNRLEQPADRNGPEKFSRCASPTGSTQCRGRCDRFQ